MNNLTSYCIRTNEREKKTTTTNLCVFFFSSLTSQHGQKNKRLETQILQMEVVIPVIKELRSRFARAHALRARALVHKFRGRLVRNRLRDQYLSVYYTFILLSRPSSTCTDNDRKKKEQDYSYVMTCIICV